MGYKYDPNCECGLCPYCKGLEDLNGLKTELQAIVDSELADLRTKLEAVEAANKVMREALEHYADEKNWNPCESDDTFHRHYDGDNCVQHGCEVAQIALSNATTNSDTEKKIHNP